MIQSKKLIAQVVPAIKLPRDVAQVFSYIVPKKMGGSDHEDNLQIVPTDVWASYTPVENYLIRLLKAEKIKRKEAWQLIKDFKNGKVTADEILKRQ